MVIGNSTMSMILYLVKENKLMLLQMDQLLKLSCIRMVSLLKIVLRTKNYK